MDLISVIVPAYNAESSIKRCISSILHNLPELNKCNVGLQVIVVNDGSTDKTQEILESLFNNDSHVEIVEQDNQGVGAARENGLSKVKGDYIAFCDSDDWVDPDWLASMYRILKEQNADIVSFKAKVNGINSISTNIAHSDATRERGVGQEVTESVTLNRDECIKEFLLHKRLNGILWTKFFDAKLFDGIHFDPKLRCFEDADVMWKILHKVNKLVLVDEAKYNWMISDTSLSNGVVSESRLESSIRLFSKMKSDIVNLHEPQFSNLVESMCLKWFFGGIKEMFRYNATYPQIEQVMLNELRRNPFQSIHTQKRLSDIIFLCLLMLSSSLARKVYKYHTK